MPDQATGDLITLSGSLSAFYLLFSEPLSAEFLSVHFSNHIEKLMINGNSHIQFVIGGSLGLSENVLNKADDKISFSDMTFPHQLMRVILSEQIYRAFRIMNHEPYHK